MRDIEKALDKACEFMTDLPARPEKAELRCGVYEAQCMKCWREYFFELAEVDVNDQA